MNSTPYQASTRRVLDRCDAIVEKRHEIANQLRSHASAFVGAPRRQVVRLSHFFDSNVTPIDLLGDPESAAVTASLLRHDNPSTPPSTEPAANLSDSIRGACLSLSFAPSRHIAVLVQLLYPLVLLMICGLVAVLYSVLLVPVFEQMFDEFGLSLPASTQIVMTVAGWIRNYGLYVVAFMALGLAYQLFVTLWPSIRKTSSRSTLSNGRPFEHPKTTWARWAWHMATLLEAGVDAKDAIAIAGNGSGKRWMKRCCDDWVTKLQQGENPFHGLLHVNGVRVSTIGHAMQLASPPDQAAMLRDTALNYRDLNRSQTLWWWTWLTPVTITFVAFFIWFAFVALLSPLVELISGLT